MIPSAEKVLEGLAEKIAEEKPWRVIITFEPETERFDAQGTFRYYFSSGGSKQELAAEEEPQKFRYNYSQIAERRDKLSDLIGNYGLCDFMIRNSQVTRCADIVISTK